MNWKTRIENLLLNNHEPTSPIPRVLRKVVGEMVEEIERRLPAPLPEPLKVCRDCAHAHDDASTLRCDRKVDAVTGEFVLCVDERHGNGIVLPLEYDDDKTTWRCAGFGRHWEPKAKSQKAKDI